MLRYAVFVALLSATLACEAFPNNTQATFNWWQCYESSITYYNATPEDSNGKFEYPIVLTKPLLVVADIDNKGKDYSSLTLSIRIWEWGGFLGCQWNEINTFGLLSNLDACTHGVPCPIKTGRQTITLTIDFSKFQAIIGLLKNDAPYQIEITLKDNNSSDKTCVMAQGRALTH
ncbi:hypothetical protein QR680_011816 [Steinernema hermaphroditum]|uniref:MD-2-related lipid-recognition domain-containing protein n=1 Tax=Steinernema hermaphroditum TaxID=289476 RepID=A0AA39LZE1_9BILA|nr:hypothetical protein QR680_011816 [Steinernema hermaphroditum]